MFQLLKLPLVYRKNLYRQNINNRKMDIKSGLGREWLVANGLGGYSSSTIIGCNARKYHGLLVASLEPPIKRHVLLSKLEEEVEFEGRIHRLSTNEYVGSVYPEGYKWLSSFENDPFPTWTFKLGDVSLIKKLFTLHGHNAVLISYRVSNPQSRGIKISLRPLITSRGIHQTGGDFNPEIVDQENHVFSFTNETFLGIGCYPGKWVPSGLSEEDRWYRRFHYRLERERGYPSVEDLYCPGQFLLKPRGSIEFTVLAVGGRNEGYEPFMRLFKPDNGYYEKLINREIERRKSLTKNFRKGTDIKEDKLDPLIISADSFVVERRKPRGKSIIAGYHWFSDFGRDTFISLPGLTLVTRRFEDAKRVIWTFSEAIKHGLIPNNFSEDGTPYFNGVDASLWFIYAAQKYYEYTGDNEFIKRLMPSMKAIVRGFMKGNQMARVGEDGLISILPTSKALTWMDVNVGDHHATPRFGRVVEINALWFNALRFLGDVVEDSNDYDELAAKVQSGYKVFWNEDRGCLFDFVLGDEKNASIRPNQIFSLSLPYSPLDREKGVSIIKVVGKELLTPYGLRSLERSNPEYRGYYAGDTVSRDLAYHQGTVWSWLLGPFITAFVKIRKHSVESKDKARELLRPLNSHMSESGLGTISEIFDAEPPYKPRGCISQAWSVGEVLRAYYEDILEIKRPNK
jgi:predicted glycogen debranching enzyme